MPTLKRQRNPGQVPTGAALQSIGQDMNRWAARQWREEQIQEHRVREDLQQQNSAEAMVQGAIFLEKLKQSPGTPEAKQAERDELFDAVGQLALHAPRQVGPFLQSHQAFRSAQSRQQAMPRLQGEISAGINEGWLPPEQGEVLAYQFSQGGDPMEILGVLQTAKRDWLQQQTDQVNAAKMTQMRGLLFELPGIEGYGQSGLASIGSEPNALTGRMRFFEDVEKATRDMTVEGKLGFMASLAQLGSQGGPQAYQILQDRVQMLDRLEQAEERAGKAQYGLDVHQALQDAAAGDPAAAARLDALQVPPEAVDAYGAQYGGKKPKRVPRGTSATAGDDAAAAGEAKDPGTPMAAPDRMEAVNDLAILLGQIEQRVAQAQTPEEAEKIKAEGSKELEQFIKGLGMSEEQVLELLQKLQAGQPLQEPQPQQHGSWLFGQGAPPGSGNHPTASFKHGKTQKERLRDG